MVRTILGVMVVAGLMHIPSVEANDHRVTGVGELEESCNVPNWHLEARIKTREWAFKDAERQCGMRVVRRSEWREEGGCRFYPWVWGWMRTSADFDCKDTDY